MSVPRNRPWSPLFEGRDSRHKSSRKVLGDPSHQVHLETPEIGKFEKDCDYGAVEDVVLLVLGLGLSLSLSQVRIQYIVVAIYFTF